MSKETAWEALRHLTIDQLVTKTKLSGCASGVTGYTTPESWPFVVTVAIGSPGNEPALEWAREFHAKLAEAASFAAEVGRPLRPCPCGAAVDVLHNLCGTANEGYYVECPVCRHRGPTRYGAIPACAAWNGHR